MVDIVDLASRRWARGDRRPEAHSPRDALVETLRQIDAGEFDPAHVIVCIAVNEPGEFDHGTRYMQGGSFPYHGQVGLLSVVRGMMNE